MRDDPPLQRKHTRLNPAVYRALGTICSLTICAREQQRVFSDVRAAAAAVEALRSHARARAVPLYGYCIMPEHVHLVAGPSPGCDLITFVGQFKNLAQRAVWRLGVRGKIWQTGFYDHFLRAEEQVELVVEYVLDNPIRRGLSRRRGDYPFAGSMVYDL